MRRDWWDDALCQEVGTEVFFPTDGEDARNGMSRGLTKQAKQICAKCPVTEDCLEFASRFSHRELYGIWGGTTRYEREGRGHHDKEGDDY